MSFQFNLRRNWRKSCFFALWVRVFNVSPYLHLFLSAVLIFKGRAEKIRMFNNLLPHLSDGPCLNSHKSTSVFVFFLTSVYKCSYIHVTKSLHVYVTFWLAPSATPGFFGTHPHLCCLTQSHAWRAKNIYSLLLWLLFMQNAVKGAPLLCYIQATNNSSKRHTLPTLKAYFSLLTTPRNSLNFLSLKYT